VRRRESRYAARVSVQPLVITHADTAWHEAFIRYVPRVFPRVSFRRWYELGGWNEDYRAFAIADGNEIVANASLHRMSILLNGRALTGWQLGAVGVVPEWRGRGLQRPIMERLLGSVPAEDIVFLFANDTVLDFYPLFGFRRVAEAIFAADHAMAPSRERLRVLSLENAADRALLERIASQSAPVTRDFGARDYSGILLWYWANFYEGRFHYCEREDAILVAEEEKGTLRLCDVLSREPFGLREWLPALARQPARRIEFGFTPGAWWPEARPAAEYIDSPLFVRGDHAMPRGPFKFPMLAQT
jgi:predicted N-acetyltransferase YhbS